MTIRINSQTVINGKTTVGTTQGDTVLWDASSLTTDLLGNTITNYGSVAANTSIYTLGAQSVAVDVGGKFLEWPSSTAPGTRDFFYGIWTRWARYGSGPACFFGGFGRGSVANTLNMFVWHPSYYSYGLSLYIGGDNTFRTNYIPTENTWHHLAVSRSGSTFRVFVDGTIRGTFTSSPNLTSPFRVGSGSTNDVEYTNGYINSAQLVLGRPVVTSNFTITSPSYRVT